MKKQFNPDEFITFMRTLSPSIDHLKRENGKHYPNHIKKSYQGIVSFIKYHQDKLKVAADRDQLHKILSDIFENEGNDIRNRLAHDATALTNYPQLRAIIDKNPLLKDVRIYLRNFYASSSPMNDSHRMKLTNFYEDNKELFDSLCNFTFDCFY